MLKFFRKIRQKLLSENSFSKYLLYALGEIALIMIGILLALQVNNWNNQKKDAQLTQQYLMDLKEDAQNNVAALDRFIQRAANYVAKVDDFQQRKGNKLSKIDLDSIGIHRQTYFLKMDTYEEVIANGHLKLLPKEVKATLREISSSFKSINKIDEHETRLLNNQQLKMRDYYELIRLDKPSSFRVILPAKANVQAALLTYKNYVYLSYDWMKTQQFFYGRMKKEQLKLIDLLAKGRTTF
ncbi:MAG: DUF6090 family protein [Bacteroidota bacterium]